MARTRGRRRRRLGPFAALLGNLIIPMLAWMMAAFAGSVLALLNEGHILSTLTQLALFGVLLMLFPYVVRMLGRQWTEASRTRVKIVVLAFIIACRLTRPTAGASSANVPICGLTGTQRTRGRSGQSRTLRTPVVV